MHTRTYGDGEGLTRQFLSSRSSHSGWQKSAHQTEFDKCYERGAEIEGKVVQVLPLLAKITFPMMYLLWIYAYILVHRKSNISSTWLVLEFCCFSCWLIAFFPPSFGLSVHRCHHFLLNLIPFFSDKKKSASYLFSHEYTFSFHDLLKMKVSEVNRILFHDMMNIILWTQFKMVVSIRMLYSNNFSLLIFFLHTARPCKCSEFMFVCLLLSNNDLYLSDYNTL